MGARQDPGGTTHAYPFRLRAGHVGGCEHPGAGRRDGRLRQHPAFKPAETIVCNNSTMPCTNISNLMLNQGNGPDFIQNASGWGVVPPSLYQGRKINLRQASNTRFNEDFIITKAGTLGQLCGASGANALDATSYACLNFAPTYPVYQGQFAPNGNESGFCVGAMSATLGFKARLERCGSPRSFWIADLAVRSP